MRRLEEESRPLQNESQCAREGMGVAPPRSRLVAHNPLCPLPLPRRLLQADLGALQVEAAKDLEKFLVEREDALEMLDEWVADQGMQVPADIPRPRRKVGTREEPTSALLG